MGANRRRVMGSVWALVLIGAGAVLPGSIAKADSGATAVAVCPKPAPGHFSCLSLRRTDIKPHTEIAQVLSPFTAPKGYTPADLQAAYAIPTNLGSGATVAIVDAFNDPTAEADLAVYRNQYGLPSCSTANGCFHQVSQTGSSTLPSTDAGWAGEIALDIEMVSASCPLCHILLVEANSDSIPDLGAAENYAAAQPGVRAVSNSYGGSEDTTDPSTSNEYYNHPGVAVVASAGDYGYGAEFPAASPNVIAVGGTSLNRASNARGWTESVWDTSAGEGTGSGCSAIEAKPAWQHDTGCYNRTVSDISADADPKPGVAVYDSNSGGWTVVGGTSVSAPLISGMYAEANATNPSADYAYLAANASGLNDVTSGSNESGCSTYLCEAVSGYDGPTGNGSPHGLLALGGTGAATAPAPPTCNSNQLLTNPGFESGTQGWGGGSGVIGKHTGALKPHTGSESAVLDNHGKSHTDTLTQTVQPGSACKTATVSFWMRINTSETTTTAKHDVLTVTLDGKSVGTWSNLNHRSKYKKVSVQIALPSGTTSAVLKFVGKENGSKKTAFVIDDVSITAS